MEIVRTRWCKLCAMQCDVEHELRSAAPCHRRCVSARVLWRGGCVITRCVPGKCWDREGKLTGTFTGCLAGLPGGAVQVFAMLDRANSGTFELADLVYAHGGEMVLLCIRAC